MTASAQKSGVGDREHLRAWLEYIAQTAIDWLDDLDAGDADREDDDIEDAGWRA